jgi:hypothetical protein
VEHVVEEGHAGGYLAGATAIEAELHPHVGFAGGRGGSFRCAWSGRQGPRRLQLGRSSPTTGLAAMTTIQSWLDTSAGRARDRR